MFALAFFQRHFNAVVRSFMFLQLVFGVKGLVARFAFDWFFRGDFGMFLFLFHQLYFTPQTLFAHFALKWSLCTICASLTVCHFRFKSFVALVARERFKAFVAILALVWSWDSTGTRSTFF